MESPFASKLSYLKRLLIFIFHDVDLTFYGCPAPINLSKPLTGFLLLKPANRRDAQIFRQILQILQIRRYE
ncbi:hypothetical protein DCT98_01620 [Salmonella enterica]|nr:hypothetical protein [Salmonella enterica]